MVQQQRRSGAHGGQQDSSGRAGPVSRPLVVLLVTVAAIAVAVYFGPALPWGAATPATPTEVPDVETTRLQLRADELRAAAAAKRSNDVLKESLAVLDQIVARKEATTAQKAVALDQLARDAGFIGQEGRALKARKALVALAPANMTAQEELGKSLLVTGKLAEAVDMLTAAAAVDPSNAFIQVHLGWALCTLFRETEGVDAYAKAYAGAGGNNPRIATRKLYGTYIDALHRIKRHDEALRVAELAAAFGVFPSALQRSENNAPEAWHLRAQPWWTRDDMSVEGQALWDDLEANVDKIRAEFEQLTTPTGFKAESALLTETGDWKEFYFMSHLHPKPENCQKAPFTCALLNKYKIVTTATTGQSKFSIMKGGTHVHPHTGASNTKIRLHLGLIIPADFPAKVRVGAETRGWTEGKVIAFDDSFEHEVWFDADPSVRRVVLIVDVWHPDIKPENRAKAPRFK